MELVAKELAEVFDLQHALAYNDMHITSVFPYLRKESENDVKAYGTFKIVSLPGQQEEEEKMQSFTFDSLLPFTFKNVEHYSLVSLNAQAHCFTENRSNAHRTSQLLKQVSRNDNKNVEIHKTLPGTKLQDLKKMIVVNEPVFLHLLHDQPEQDLSKTDYCSNVKNNDDDDDANKCKVNIKNGKCYGRFKNSLNATRQEQKMKNANVLSGATFFLSDADKEALCVFFPAIHAGEMYETIEKYMYHVCNDDEHLIKCEHQPIFPLVTVPSRIKSENSITTLKMIEFESRQCAAMQADVNSVLAQTECKLNSTNKTFYELFELVYERVLDIVSQHCKRKGKIQCSVNVRQLQLFLTFVFANIVTTA